ncbi:hypothetical protein [Bifidobacterium platyrrhinorum]|uniref:Uncharacterized protein n=1 Tax=Bifidobacterium platyrrhinorum TaxID=2661628 RepID=A0A6L9SU35_9BIFI|nr:hypothetical protein [Bifidobacterium platyrrhinorum]NEG55659.1 hypothetical protein [Bifidobacterium platyrrhinorum]
MKGDTMNEDYDFFAGRDDASGDSGRRASRRARGTRDEPRRPAARRAANRRDITYHAGHRPGGVSRTLAIVALLCGLAAIACGAASAAHEIAPAYVDPDGTVPGRLIAIACAVLIGVTLVLVIIARATVPRRVSHRGVASGGIITMVFAVMLLTLGVVVGVLFPDGLVRPAVRDEAPVNSSDRMRFDVERVTGVCTSGWQDIDVDVYPGVESASVCPDTRVAYLTFDSESAAKLYRNAVRTKIGDLLGEYASQAADATGGDWRTLSGGRWIAFGDASDMTLLQKEWGGTLARIGATGGDGTSANASSAAGGRTLSIGGTPAAR